MYPLCEQQVHTGLILNRGTGILETDRREQIMTLRHLEIFLETARTKNMSEAASALYISQPSVSQAIRELEGCYGVRLFERLQKGLYLTQEGKLLAAKARKVLDAYEEMENAMRESESHPVLRLGCSVSVGTVLAETLLQRLEESCPNVSVYVTVDNTSRIETMVQNNELDLGVVEGMLRTEHLVSRPVCTDRLVLVAGKGHPFYGIRSVAPEALENQILISREEGSSNRNQYEQLLERKHIHMQKRWSSTNTEAIKNAVIHGRGLAMLSSMLVRRETEEGLVYEVPVKGVKISRQIRVFYHRDKYLTPALKQMIQICESLSQPKSEIKDGADHTGSEDGSNGIDFPFPQCEQGSCKQDKLDRAEIGKGDIL